jgi:hypothetical protein
VTFGSSDVGKAKTEEARARLSNLNPDIEIETFATKLASENALQIFREFDLIELQHILFQSFAYLIECPRDSRMIRKSVQHARNLRPLPRKQKRYIHIDLELLTQRSILSFLSARYEITTRIEMSTRTRLRKAPICLLQHDYTLIVATRS